MKRKFIKKEFKINTKMKIRIVLSVLMLIVTVGLMATCIYAQVSKIDIASENYKDKLIRFHVLANSDSEEDQQLKLKVRDAVIDYLQPKLRDSKSINESERIILEEEGNLINICRDVIEKNGYNYDVHIDLGYSKFPTKQYSSVVLPAGEYKALRILIGKGQGKNWWCVMFPPLCFVDKQNNVIDKETDAKLREVLTEEEYKLIVEKDNDKVDDLTIKFKIVEIIQKIKENYLWEGVIN
ncbi:MAG: stage II sporulation protein R [Intestinibacter sp.]|uniref:stage II sporulation protein R n=1 Tax=Intestinibacter sp. TaxID=1965304 RepID=UPI0025C2E9C5|nr:stage II sporulation protein R [Intestinibacter sp.]MCI6738107.1 stage II sporulation protein R [Intestinibacter sp.]